MEEIKNRKLSDSSILFLILVALPVVWWLIYYNGRLLGFNSFDYRFWFYFTFCLGVSGVGSHITGLLMTFISEFKRIQAKRRQNQNKIIQRIEAKEGLDRTGNESTLMISPTTTNADSNAVCNKIRNAFSFVGNIHITINLVINSYIINCFKIMWSPIYSISSGVTDFVSKINITEYKKRRSAISSTAKMIIKDHRVLPIIMDRCDVYYYFLVMRAAMSLHWMHKYLSFNKAKELFNTEEINHHLYYDYKKQFEELWEKEKYNNDNMIDNELYNNAIIEQVKKLLEVQLSM